MRHFEVKDVLSWATREEAKHYIGQTGFFGDSLAELADDVENGDHFLLSDVQDDTSRCFYLDESCYYSFFLPADKVTEVPEKTYREIDTHEEFIAVTGMDLGKILTIRLKDNPEIETSGILSSIVECKNKLQGVDIGGASYTMHDLFKRYEFYNVNDSEWAPFCLEVV